MIMRYIVMIAAALGIAFFLIAINLGDYHSRNQNFKEQKVSESVALAEKQREAMNTEPDMWDKVNNAKEKLQTTVPQETQNNAEYSVVTDENGQIIGYQQVENVEYDENGNVLSFDNVGDVISPEEYAQVTAPPVENEETTTKRPIPDVNKYRKKEAEFTIVVE